MHGVFSLAIRKARSNGRSLRNSIRLTSHCSFPDRTEKPEFLSVAIRLIRFSVSSVVQRELMMSDVFLRFPKVRAKVPYSKSWIYLAISEGRFPAPIKAFGGGRAALWLESEIDSWIRQQVELSRSSKQQEDSAVARGSANTVVGPDVEPCRTGRFGRTALHLRPSTAVGSFTNP